MKEVKQNEKDVKVGLVAANNHYDDNGPGTVNIFRENMDMGKLPFENVGITKINRELELETRFNFSYRKQRNNGKQTILDFVNL